MHQNRLDFSLLSPVTLATLQWLQNLISARQLTVVSDPDAMLQVDMIPSHCPILGGKWRGTTRQQPPCTSV